jgi:hypothetical protein
MGPIDYQTYGVHKENGYNNTSSSPIPQGWDDGCRRQYLHDLHDNIKEWNIPPELVLNADQTLSSYISVGKFTTTVKGEVFVPIKGLTDTFVLPLFVEFLQIIYGGKTTASQPCRFQFPKGFYLSQNLKNWLNEQETLKLIDAMINPYLGSKMAELKLAETQKARIVWDVFKGNRD